MNIENNSINKKINNTTDNLDKVKHVFLRHVQADKNLSGVQKKSIKNSLKNADNIQEFKAIKDDAQTLSQEKHHDNQEKINRLKTQTPTLKENSLLTAKATGGILGALALMGVGAAITGMQPRPYQDLSRIVPPDPLTAPYMNMFPTVQLSPYMQNLGQQQLENGFAKLSTIASSAGMLVLTNSFKGFSKDAREEAKKSRINLLENNLKAQEKHITNYADINNNPAYKHIMLTDSLDNFIGNAPNIFDGLKSESFTFSTEEEFEKRINEKLNEDDTPIKQAYEEFIKTDDIRNSGFDENHIKKIFTKRLYPYVIDVKFKNGFLKDITLNNPALNDNDKHKFNTGLNKFIHNLQYKEHFLSDASGNNEEALLKDIKETFKSVDNNLVNTLDDNLGDKSAVILLNKACDIMSGNSHEDYKEQTQKGLDAILKLLAMRHKQNLKNSKEYDIIKQYYEKA